MAGHELVDGDTVVWPVQLRSTSHDSSVAASTRSLKELIALAKAKPGELNYGSAGSGTPLHIAGEMLKSAAGVQLVHVPYKGPGPAVIDLLSGRIQEMVEQLYPVADHIRSGRIRPLRDARNARA